MKNPLTMFLPVTAHPKADKDLTAFVSRLEAKMEGRLHAKEDTFTLAYVIAEKIRRMLLDLPHDESFDFGSIISPLESGYTRVTETTGYSVGTGFGWQVLRLD